MQTKEVWRNVRGYEGFYLISNTGRVKSLHKSRRYLSLINSHESNKKYLLVHLNKNKSKTTKSIHRLVAEAFIENPENKPCVDHIDGDKKNNHASNLRWCTWKENQNNPITRKRISEAGKGKRMGALNHKSRAVKCVELDRGFECGLAAERELGTFSENISKAAHGERKRAGGYHWVFI